MADWVIMHIGLCDACIHSASGTKLLQQRREGTTLLLNWQPSHAFMIVTAHRDCCTLQGSSGAPAANADVHFSDDSS